MTEVVITDCVVDGRVVFVLINQRNTLNNLPTIIWDDPTTPGRFTPMDKLIEANVAFHDRLVVLWSALNETSPRYYCVSVNALIENYREACRFNSRIWKE